LNTSATGARMTSEYRISGRLSLLKSAGMVYSLKYDRQEFKSSLIFFWTIP
jgi:hypothetical protein